MIEPAVFLGSDDRVGAQRKAINFTESEDITKDLIEAIQTKLGVTFENMESFWCEG